MLNSASKCVLTFYTESLRVACIYILNYRKYSRRSYRSSSRISCSTTSNWFDYACCDFSTISIVDIGKVVRTSCVFSQSFGCSGSIIDNGSIVDTSYSWIFVILYQGSAVTVQSNGTVDLLSDGDLIVDCMFVVCARNADHNVWISTCLCLTNLKIPGCSFSYRQLSVKWIY